MPRQNPTYIPTKLPPTSLRIVESILLELRGRAQDIALKLDEDARRKMLSELKNLPAYLEVWLRKTRLEGVESDRFYDMFRKDHLNKALRNCEKSPYPETQDAELPLAQILLAMVAAIQCEDKDILEADLSRLEIKDLAEKFVYDAREKAVNHLANRGRF